MVTLTNRIAIIRNGDTDVEDVIEQLTGFMGTANVMVVNADTNPFPESIQAVDFDFYVISKMTVQTLHNRNLMMQLHQHVMTNRKVIFVQGKFHALFVTEILGIPNEQKNRVRYYEDPMRLVPMINAHLLGYGFIGKRAPAGIRGERAPCEVRGERVRCEVRGERVPDR